VTCRCCHCYSSTRRNRERIKRVLVVILGVDAGQAGQDVSVVVTRWLGQLKRETQGGYKSEERLMKDGVMGDIKRESSWFWLHLNADNRPQPRSIYLTSFIPFHSIWCLTSNPLIPHPPSPSSHHPHNSYPPIIHQPHPIRPSRPRTRQRPQRARGERVGRWEWVDR
jgi:hypothetical protein